MANELRGAKELTQQIKALGALENGNVLRAAMKKGAAPVVAAAQANAPVRTTDEGGALRKTYKGKYVAPGFGRRSVHAAVVVSRDKQSAAALIGPSKEAHYLSSFVEVGSSQRAAHPWLVPALQSAKPQALNAIVEDLRRSLKRVAKKQGAR